MAFRKKRIVIPESLIEAARHLNQQSEERAAKALREQLREKRERDRLQKRNRQEAFPHATKVFEWAYAFRRSSQGQELISLFSRYETVHGILLFSGELPSYPTRAIGVSLEGVWWRRFGCGAAEQFVNSPAGLAENVPAPVLDAAWKSFQGEDIWKRLADRLDRLTGKRT